MKYLILSLFLGLSLLGQAQSTFNKSYYFVGDSTNTLNEVYTVAELNNAYILTSLIVDQSSYQYLAVTKVNSSGSNVKQYNHKDTTQNYIYYQGNSMIIDNDSNIIIVSAIRDRVTSYVDAIVIKLNKNLDTIWTKEFALPASIAQCSNGLNPIEAFTAIQQTADSGYIIVGNYAYQCDINKQRAFLTKVDKHGNLQWRKVYTNRKAVYDIQVVYDGGFVFTDFMNDDFRINRTDSVGNIIWSDIPNSLVNLVSGSISIGIDSVICIMAPYVYAQPSPNTYYYGANVIKYSLINNQKLWDKTYRLYKTFNTTEIHQSFELVINEKKEILIAGTSIVDSVLFHISKNKGVLLKLSPNGDSLWSRYYNPPGHIYNMGQFNDMILTSDGGILAAGYSRHYSNNYNNVAWLVKMDSMGQAPGAQTVSVDNVPSSGLGTIIKVYPNPADDILTIGFNEPLEDNIKVHLYNALGQLVYQSTLSQGQQTITLNVNNFKSGVYIVKFQNPYQILGTQKTHNSLVFLEIKEEE
jgi:hypothetical protein